jgi:hypothetical protein
MIIARHNRKSTHFLKNSSQDTQMLSELKSIIQKEL